MVALPAFTTRDARLLEPAPSGRVVATERLAPLIPPLGAALDLTLQVQGSASGRRRADTKGWLPMSVLLTELPDRHHASVAREGDPRRQAADLVPHSLAVPALAYVLPALLVDALPIVPNERAGSGWLLHEHPDGWVDGAALPAGTYGSSSPGAAEVAAGVVALVDPWLRRLCSVLPITERTAWGGVVDVLTGGSLAAAREGLDVSPDDVWGRLQRVVDRLAQVVPLPGRPRRFDVVHAAGTAVFPVRSTCCLHYRTHAAPERDGEGYCGTCPLRTDESRQRRIAAYLDSVADSVS